MPSSSVCWYIIPLHCRSSSKFHVLFLLDYAISYKISKGKRKVKIKIQIIKNAPAKYAGTQNIRGTTQIEEIIFHSKR